MERMKKKVGPVRVTPKTSKQLNQRETRLNSPAAAILPKEYPMVLADLKRRISEERIRTVLAANAAMVMLYWDIGRIILGRQEQKGWGTKVVDRLSMTILI